MLPCSHLDKSSVDMKSTEMKVYYILYFSSYSFVSWQKKTNEKMLPFWEKWVANNLYIIYQSSPPAITPLLHRFYLHKGTHMKSKKWYISQFWYCPFKWMSVQWKLMFNRIMKIDKITFQMQVPILNSSEICSAMGLQKGCICICIGCKWHEDCCHHALLWS